MVFEFSKTSRGEIGFESRCEWVEDLDVVELHDDWVEGRKVFFGEVKGML